MRIAFMPCRSAQKGLKVLLGCLILSLLACISASAQEDTALADNLTVTGADLYDYAEVRFVIPSEVTSEGESRFKDNYSVGRYVAASILLNESRINESRIYMFLLYPCEAPETWLDALGVKSAIESFNAGLNQTIYSPTPLNISGQPAIWGQFGNQILVAYQPSVETVSMTFIDQNITEAVLEYLLESLQISVNESALSLWPGNCAGGEEEGAAEAEVQPEQTAEPEVTNVTEKAGEPEVTNVTEKASEPEVTNVTEKAGEPEVIEETNQTEGTRPEFSKEQMEADLKAIEEKLEDLKRW